MCDTVLEYGVPGNRTAHEFDSFVSDTITSIVEDGQRAWEHVSKALDHGKRFVDRVLSVCARVGPGINAI
jgi:hypothetical protein